MAQFDIDGGFLKGFAGEVSKGISKRHATRIQLMLKSQELETKAIESENLAQARLESEERVAKAKLEAAELANTRKIQAAELANVRKQNAAKLAHERGLVSPETTSKLQDAAKLPREGRTERITSAEGNLLKQQGSARLREKVPSGAGVVQRMLKIANEIDGTPGRSVQKAFGGDGKSLTKGELQSAKRIYFADREVEGFDELLGGIVKRRASDKGMKSKPREEAIGKIQSSIATRALIKEHRALLDSAPAGRATGGAAVVLNFFTGMLPKVGTAQTFGDALGFILARFPLNEVGRLSDQDRETAKKLAGKPTLTRDEQKELARIMDDLISVNLDNSLELLRSTPGGLPKRFEVFSKAGEEAEQVEEKSEKQKEIDQLLKLQEGLNRMGGGKG